MAKAFKMVIKVLEDRVLGFYITILDYHLVKSEYDNILVSYLTVIGL